MVDYISIENATIHISQESCTPSEDGAYKTVLGAYDVWSRNGHYYPLTAGVKSVYSVESVLQQRIASGDVKIEVGHPKYTPGMKIADYLDALMITREDNVCGVITKIDLSDVPVNVPGQPTPIYLVTGHIKPHGPKSILLERSLMSVESNTALSVRGLNYAKRVGGVLYKEIHTVNTYDFVPAPGISVAAKSEWSKFSIESDITVNLNDSDVDDILLRLRAREEVATEGEMLMINDIRSKLTGCDDSTCIFRSW